MQFKKERKKNTKRKWSSLVLAAAVACATMSIPTSSMIVSGDPVDQQTESNAPTTDSAESNSTVDGQTESNTSPEEPMKSGASQTEQTESNPAAANDTTSNASTSGNAESGTTSSSSTVGNTESTQEAANTNAGTVSGQLDGTLAGTPAQNGGLEDGTKDNPFSAGSWAVLRKVLADNTGGTVDNPVYIKLTEDIKAVYANTPREVFDITKGAFVLLTNGYNIDRNCSGFVEGGSVFALSGENVSLVINNENSNKRTEIKGGYAVNGGAFSVSNGARLTISNCTITGNKATEKGAGIYNNGGYVTLGAIVTGNTVIKDSEDLSGAGIYVEVAKTEQSYTAENAPIVFGGDIEITENYVKSVDGQTSRADNFLVNDPNAYGLSGAIQFAEGGFEHLPQIGIGTNDTKGFIVDISSSGYTTNATVKRSVSASKDVAKTDASYASYDVNPVKVFEVTQVFISDQTSKEVIIDGTTVKLQDKQASSEEDPNSGSGEEKSTGTVKVEIKDEDGFKFKTTLEVAELAEIVLTEEEKNRVKNGESANIWFEISDISDTISEEAKALIDSAAKKGFKAAQYVDISLYKQLSGDVSATAVTETAQDITLTLVVPDKLISKDTNIKRSYTILRNHDGVATPVKETLHYKKSHKLKFDTNLFSDYAIAIKDTFTGTGSNDDEDDSADTSGRRTRTSRTGKLGSNRFGSGSVRTGDTNNQTPWVLLIIAGAIGAMGLIFYKKKYVKKEEE